MRLPDFICPGAQKAGTTSLHEILNQHPEIFLPRIKETKFFQDDELYEKGLEHYQKEFTGYRNEKRVGEIDPDYLFYDYVPGRIAKALPDIKLVFMLRHPVDRAYSSYWMSVRRGLEDKPFIEAIELEEKRISRDDFSLLHFSYMARGYYARQIKKYMEFFDKERMYFIVFEEDFLKNRRDTVTSLLAFLDVDPHVELELNIRSNPAGLPRSSLLGRFVNTPNRLKKLLKIFVPGERLRRNILLQLDKYNRKPFKYPSLERSLRQKLLREYYLQDIRELSELIGRDLSIWLTL